MARNFADETRRAAERCVLMKDLLIVRDAADRIEELEDDLHEVWMDLDACKEFCDKNGMINLVHVLAILQKLEAMK